MHISFVILHYITLIDTVECVESIINNIKYSNYSIIIVDNGSPNGSGRELLDRYENIKEIKVILNKENVGFSKGNNIGFRYAKYEKKAEFIVMINNDTIIKQADFCSEIVNQYKLYKYDVCGPDIISLVDKNHQNPMPKIFNNEIQVKRMIIKFKILLVLNYIRCDKLVENIFNNRKKNLIKKVLNSEDFQLHGSCLIFSPNYIKKYNGLYDKPFMYIEECILKYIAERDGLNLLYSDKLMIYHKEDSSTNATMSKEYKKRRFFYKHSINSCNILLNLMNQGDES